MQQMTDNLPAKASVFRAGSETADFILKRLNRSSPACESARLNRRVKFLRLGLGFIYLWFGALKFFPNLSSAEGLAGATLEIMTFGLMPPPVSMPLLALWESAIGLALLTGKFRRLAVISLYFHVAGTLVPLVLLPDQTWTTPLVAASLEGQYIFKNLITIGAALVINAAEGCRR